MFSNYITAIQRFFTVTNLFLGIMWAFFSLNIKKYWHSKTWIEEKKQELYRTKAKHFRETAIKLGGILIKLGQFFSTRVDLLPSSSIQELSGLQDEVEAVNFAQIKKLAENEFARPLQDIFEYLKEIPIASASLGQVHYGILSNGEKVAVKFMRPGIERLVSIDLWTLKKIIAIIKIFTDWERYIDLDAVYKEFKETLWNELNYIKEGRNAETIAGNSSGDLDYLVPGIKWQHTSKRVLTMDYMQGIKISDYKNIQKAGLDCKILAEKLLEIYIKQILIDGFYHADPHPGNLFVSTDGKIIMVDFGMVGEITPDFRSVLIELVKALVRRDYPEVVYYLKTTGVLHPDTPNDIITRALALFIEHTLGNGPTLSITDINNFLSSLESLLYEQPFQIPAKFTFLGRALGTLYGICIGLNPDISFIDVAKPYVEKFLGHEKLGPWEIFKEKSNSIAISMLEIPTLLYQSLSKLERGDIFLKVSAADISAKITDNTRMLRTVAWALVFGFTILTSAYLLVNNYRVLACAGFALAFIILLLMIRIAGISENRRKIKQLPAMKKND